MGGYTYAIVQFPSDTILPRMVLVACSKSHSTNRNMCKPPTKNFANMSYPEKRAAKDCPLRVRPRRSGLEDSSKGVGEMPRSLHLARSREQTYHFVRVFFGILGMRSGPPWPGKSSWVPDMAPGASKCARDARCPGDSICELRTMS